MALGSPYLYNRPRGPNTASPMFLCSSVGARSRAHNAFLQASVPTQIFHAMRPAPKDGLIR